MRRWLLPALVGVIMAGLAAPASAGDLTPQEQHGKQLYQEGIGADGKSIMASLSGGGLTLPATSVPCGSCHGPDGLGRPETGIIPSNITWANLTKPYGLRHANGREHPPYTPETFLGAVTSGVDPAGNVLDPVMPRYALDIQQARDLVAYLKRLGSNSDRRIAADEIVIATAAPRDGPLAEVGKVTGSLLAAFVDHLNGKGGIYGRKVVLETVAFDPSGAAGEADSAAGALRRLAADTKVFAVVAPIVAGQAAAFADFAESTGVPVIGPIAQRRPAEIQRQGATFYLAAGLDEQMRALVEYARSDLHLTEPRIAILLSGAGPTIDEAIREQSKKAGWTPVLSLDLAGGGAALERAVMQLRLAAVDTVFYAGDPARFAALADVMARSQWQPRLLTTGTAMTRAAFARLKGAGVRVFVAYPVLGSDQSPAGSARLHALQAAGHVPARYLPMQVAALSAARVLVEGLQRSGRQVSRRKLVAALAALQHFHTELMPPITFGSNRRIGIRGAHIVALGGGKDEPGNVWVSLE